MTPKPMSRSEWIDYLMSTKWVGWSSLADLILADRALAVAEKVEECVAAIENELIKYSGRMIIESRYGNSVDNALKVETLTSVIKLIRRSLLPASPAAVEQWTCRCGYMNNVGICTHCGKLKPAAECRHEWYESQFSGHKGVCVKCGATPVSGETKGVE